jgi:hypothetical protein
MRRMGSVGLLLAVLLVLPMAARAQVAPESPLLLPPAPGSGLGIFLMETWGGGLGVLGTWRAPTTNWGLRLGIAEDSGPDDDIAAFGGLDFMGRVNRSTTELPLDIDWLVGAFLSIGDDLWLSIPFGITAGHTFRGQGADFVPFVTPRVVLDGFFVDNDGAGDDSEFDFDFAADLGLDIRFRRNLTLRFAASLGRDALGIGLVF